MIVNRLTHAAQMTRDKKLAELLTEAAKTIETLETWRVRWSEKDLAYTNLYEHFRLMRARAFPHHIDSLLTVKSYKGKEEEMEELYKKGQEL